ncbi:MAG: adenylate kinase [Oligoflexales bacterium]|nr:adenylate kinase [Oligoflexales bacterium]
MKKPQTTRFIIFSFLSIFFAGLCHAKTSIILLGPPASAQAKFLVKKLGVPSISTGDLLRAELSSKSEISLKIKDTMSQGKLVADEIVIDLVKKRIAEKDCQNGFILDGFPRTIPQAVALKTSNIEINYVVNIAVPDSEVIGRISGRRVHPASGHTYHVKFNPPKVEGKDDQTGEDLITRKDDSEEVIKKRLEIYKSQTNPLIDWYKKEKNIKFIDVDGSKDIKKVSEEIGKFF